MQNSNDVKQTEAYEAPAVTDIASVHELTLGRYGHKRQHHAFDGQTRANKPYFGAS